MGTTSRSVKLNNFRKYIDDGLNNKEGCFTIIDKKINKIIGTTRYYFFNQEDLSIRLYIYFSKYWGTKMNYQIKETNVGLYFSIIFFSFISTQKLL